MTYALVDSSGVVVNLIVYDGKAEYALPTGMTLVADDGTAQIGGTWDGTKFNAPA